MTWLERRGRPYYYRSRREGDRVIQEYLGTGLLATLEAQQDEQERAERERERATFQDERRRLQTLDSGLVALSEATEALAHLALLTAGYHRHARGHWRRRRTHD